jgi:DNA-directed RNA polymerase specialized sigma subunit
VRRPLFEIHAYLKRESAESNAERIIQQELKRLRWSPGELSQRPKRNPAKLAIAARLRRETTRTLPWIAARLQARTWKSLNAKLYRWRKMNESLEKESGL